MAEEITDLYRHTAEFYDHLPLYANRGDVAFYVDAARASGGPVVELGCGTGRILLPCARAGVEMIGLDASPLMIERFKLNLAREPRDVQSRVTIAKGDMRTFSFGLKFRLIIIPFRGFQHLLTPEDQLQCLNAVKLHLLKDGVLLFDLYNPFLPYLVDERLSHEQLEGDPVILPDGRTVHRASRHVARDPIRQVNTIEFVYHLTHPDGRRERLSHQVPMRYTYRYELEHLLHRAGLVPEHFFGDFNKRPFGTDYPGELIALARKITH